MTRPALRLLGDRWTYLRILYLLLAFPLGTIYFVVLLTVGATGVSLALVLVGLVILAVMVPMWMLAARLERELAIHLLGARMRPLTLQGGPGGTAWERLRAMLGETTTWTSLVYLMLEFPFGIVGFTLTLALITTSIGLILLPFAYVSYVIFPGTVVINPPPQLVIGGPPFGVRFLAVLAVGIVGIGLLLGSLALLNGIGWLWARFAELMLGVSQARLQLAAAQAEARTQQARAERADQSRRELIVNASHELRTPVASISAHVESLLKPERPMDDETRQYLEVVAAESDRLGTLVDDVLALARAEAGELRLNLRPVAVAEIIDQVCDALAPLARRERNLSLVRDSASGLPEVMADRDRLAQVLTNLVRNAVNNTPDGGIISVDAALSDDHVVISVSDTGIGIDAQDLPRIFDRFYRTDPSRTRDSGGSGLGLAIVRELLAAMGGSITAESTPGHGSVFRVALQHAKA